MISGAKNKIGFALIVLVIFPVVHAAIPTAERNVLLDLYTRTNGTSWLDSSGWNGPPGTECRNWHGITCDSTSSHITEISLNSNFLTGELPNLNGLSGIQFIDVGGNRIS